MKNIIIETPKNHEKKIYKHKFQCTKKWGKEMLIKNYRPIEPMLVQKKVYKLKKCCTNNKICKIIEK
jgi:hypothetical protein